MAYEDLFGALGRSMAPNLVDDGPIEPQTLVDRLTRKGIADIERPRAPAQQAPSRRAPKAPEPAIGFGADDEIVDTPKAAFGNDDQIVDAISDGVPIPRPRPEQAGDGFSAFEQPTPPLSPQVDPSMLSPDSIVSKKQPLVGGVEIAPENLAPKKTPKNLTEAWDSVGIGRQAKEQLGSGVETLKQGWYGTNLQTNMRALSVFDKVDAGDAVDPMDDPVGYSQLSPEQRAKVRRDLEQKVGENIAGIVKSKREQEGVALDPKKAQTFDKAPIGYGRNPLADEIVKAGNEGRWGDVWKTFKADPLGITQQFALESLPVSAPMLAAGIGLAPFGAVPTILGTFGLSYGSEFGPRVVENVSEELTKLKIDLHDEAAVAAALKANPNIVKQAADKAARGAAGPALFDAISFGAMKGIKPGGTLAGNTGRVARNMGLELATEPLGEAAGQVLEEGKVDKPGDLIAETLGAGPQVIGGTAGATIREGRDARREGFQPAPVGETPPAPESAPSTLPNGVQTQGGSGGGSPAETASQPLQPGAREVSEPAPGDTPKTPAEAAVAPQELPPAPAATNPEADRDRAVLRAYGYSDQQITDMSAAQRKAEVEDAVSSGIDPDQAMAEFAKQDAAMSDLTAMFGDGDKAAGTKAAPVKVETSADVEAAAAAAATDYSPEQGEANNRPLGHLKWNGLQGSIEVASGGTRRGTNPKTGEPWETTHSVPYGYWKNTIGADKMHVDAYFGPEMEAGHPVYVLDENDPATGKFRQIKTFAGFPSAEAARQAYLGTSSKTPDMIGGITPIDAAEFPTWVKDKRNTTKPASPKVQKVEQRQPKGNLSLMQYLAWRGGIRPDGDIRSMQLPRNIAVPGVGYRSLIRSGGMPIDKMVEAARDGGYLPSAPTDRPDDVSIGRQLLDMLDEESRGRKTFPEGTEATTKQDEERAAEQSESDRDKLMAEFAAAGVPVESVDPLDLVEAERIMQEEGLEPDDAFEAAVMRRARIEDVATEPEFGNIYGEDWWDAVQSDAALQDGAASQEEGVDSERPVAEGRDDAQGGELPGAREDRGEEVQETAGNDDAGEASEPRPTAEAAEDRDEVAFGADDEVAEPEVTFGKPLIKPFTMTTPQGDVTVSIERQLGAESYEEINGKPGAIVGIFFDGGPIEGDRLGRNGVIIQGEINEDTLRAAAEEVWEQVKPEQTEAIDESALTSNEVDAIKAALKNKKVDRKGELNKRLRAILKAGKTDGDEDVKALETALRMNDPEVEQTAAGEQTVLPGAEKATDADLAQKKADEPLKPDVAQKPADEGLFGDERNQGDLIDEIKKKPAEEKGEAEVSTGEIETVTQAEPEVDQKKAKLEDAGEKIGGARKDQWAGTLAAHDLDEMTGAEREAINKAFDRWAKSLATGEGKHGAGTKLQGSTEPEPVEQTTHNVEVPEIAPEEKVDQLETEMAAVEESTENANDRDLSEVFAQHLRDGKKFEGILAARKMAKEAGHELDPKQIEEALELAVVKVARGIAADGSLSEDDAYKALVNLYSLQPRLGTRTSTSMREQAFSTPVPLAYIASRLAQIDAGMRVYEPTAGNGALLIEAIPSMTVANEINPARAKNLESQGFAVQQLDAAKAKVAVKHYDVVIANPPFGAVQNNGASTVFDLTDVQNGYHTKEIDHAIAIRSLGGMKDNGRAVLIVGGINKMAGTSEARSDGYNSKAKREFYKVLYDRYNVTDHFTVAGELYERQGAGWPVDVIVIEGRGKSQRSLPAVDVPRVYSTWNELGGLLDGNLAGAGSVRPNAGANARGDDAGGSRRGDVSGGEDAGGQRDSDRGDAAEQSEGVQPLAVSEQSERGAADLDEGAAGGSRELREPGGNDPLDPPERSPSGLDDFDAAFDAALDETFGAQEAPKSSQDAEFERGRANAAKDGPDSTRRRGGSQRERDGYDAAKRSTAEVAKSAVSNAVDSADAAMAGLVQLFGGGKTVGEGLNFDKATYEKAKPLFIQAAQRFSEFKNDVVELVKRMVGELQRSYGLTREALERMRPYLKKFIGDVQAGAVTLGEAAKKAAAPVKQEKETAQQVSYAPKSGQQGLGTLVPVNMRRSIEESLASLAERVGDLDEFVAKELGYGANSIGEYFAAEQIDALALAIDNIQRGKGFIIGDQTGIGKGRVNAGIIRWAIRNGQVPIFVTEKPNLYGDMYRDLRDIGIQDELDRDVRIVMTNNDEKVPLDEEGKVVLKTDKGQAGILAAITDPDTLREKYDVVFTTYNQMQTVKGKETGQRTFMRAMAPNAILIFDESHNAGGQQGERKKAGSAEGRAALARRLIQAAKGVFYSSATYAKRPDVMDLYSKTDMVLAVESPEALAEAISSGRVPMQQAVAAMLAEAGQYIRRERSFEGVTYDTPVVAAPRDQYDGMASALAAINHLSGFVGMAAGRVSDKLKAEAKIVLGDNAVGSAGAESINFTAIMHNVINQMLLALKAKPAVEIALEAIKRGEKPVFTVSGTMESFLTDFVDNLGIKPGEVVEGDFRDVLMKYLNRTRTITIRSPFAQNADKDGKTKHYLTDEELGSVGVRAYDEAEQIIRSLDLTGLPLSPLDYIKGEMQKAGYKIGEITGRTLTVDYSGKEPTLSSRGAKDKSIAGRRNSIRDFNSGALDAMIINQAGATGLSLHASASFKDQKRRHMIIVAPEANIDTHMQMLGRVHRTGQVITPTYSQLIADVPAEKRPAAVLAKKMASLNANTTASRGGALTAKDVPDFINEYGDMVAVAYIADHPELNPKLTFPIKLRENGSYDPDEAMRKLTGRIPLLPLAQQEEVYAALEGEFNALIEQMKAAGENALEAQSFDLKARTLETTQVVAAKDGSNSPFAAPVNVERVSVARLGKPFKPSEVMNKVSAELGGSAIEENDLPTLANMLDMLNDLYRQGWGRTAADKESAERAAAVKEFEAYKRSIVDEIGEADKAEKERVKLDAVKDRWSMIHAVLTIGRRVTLKTSNGNLTGIVLKVEQKGDPKNPLALSTWKATFAIADASRQITIPFSRLWEDGKASEDDGLAIEVAPIAQWIETPKQTLERFEQMQSDAREERFIATGNILAAYDWLDRRGSIINYTAEDGTVRQGIITSRQFDLGKHAVMKGKPLRDPQEVLAWLDKNIGQTIWAKGNVVRIRRVPSRYGQTTYSITAEKKKQTGGKFYLDKGLTTIAGDFYSSGGGMNADVNETFILPAIRRMQELGAVFTVQGEPPKPTKAGEVQANIRQNAVQLRPEVKERQADLASMLQSIVRRVAGPQVRVEFAEALPVDQQLEAWGDIKTPGTASGLFVNAENLVMLALNDPKWSPSDQVLTAFHEAFHSIESRLLTPQELEVLRAEEPRLRAMLARAYVQDLSSIKGSEVRAIAFEYYVDQRSRGLQVTGMHVAIRRGFERLMQLFRQIRNALNGMGFQTSEDIFAAALQGDIGRRGATQPRTMLDVMRDMEPEAANIRAPELAPERRGVAPPPESIEAKLRARNLPKLAAISRSLGIGGLRPAEFRTQVQDKFIRVKNIQKAQERVTGPIPERMDTYTAESLYYGRTGEQIERLDREHIDPLIREIKKRGLTLEQVNDYLYARHAPERNERIREINPDIESPSGMSDAEAEAIIAAIPEDKLADYQEIERRVREIIDQTNATRLRGGLVNEETLEQWNAAYENYVPLRGFAENTEEDEASLSTGRGMDVRGPESRRALGRESAAEGPLYYVILQAQAAIVRAEKDRVGRTMLRYVQANPNPSLWTVNNPETKRVVSPLTGMVVEMVDPAWKTKDNVFAVKVGGRQHFITFHGKDGKEIAHALKNIGAATLHPIISFMSSLTRLFARMQTAWNPEFWVSNFPRDIGEAFVNLQAQDQKRFGRLFLKYLIPAMGGAFKGQQGKFDGRFSQAFQEFDRAGGRIRFFGLEDPDDIKANVESKMRRLSGGAVNNMISAGEHAIEALEIVNGSIENATRLAAYMAARDVGLTQAQAAKIARELTVNFNRKGELGSVISAAYAFANAAMQGTVRMAQAMKSKRVRRFAYGIAAFGALLALYNIGAGGDDDDGTPFYEKIPPWERDKNFILMWPRWMGKKKGAYAKIPLPYGYLPFHILGARIASYVIGGTTKEKAISAVFKSLLDTFDPIGRDENKVAQFAPTITRPGIHIYSNENWTGKPINPVNAYGKDHRPDSERHFDSASKFSVSAAKQMNTLTGGSAFKSGYVDMSPGTIDYMLNFLGGGVGRFVANSASVPWKLYQGEEITADKAPLSRRFVGQVNKEAFDRGAYYEDRDKARDAPVSLARKAAKRGDPGAAEAYDSLSKNATQGDLAGEALFDKVDRQIGKYRAEEKKVREDAKLDETTRKQKIEEIRAEIATLRNNARKTFKEMQQGR